MLRRLAALAAPLALLGLLAGVLPSAAADAATASGSRPTSSPPVLEWTGCDDGFQCATATVPLDYARPRGRTISLALIRLPATDPAHRIGSLFVNPGGPGGSGVDFVRQAATFVYSPAVRARFDIVGFDPRFIGASRPVATCATDDEATGILGRALRVPWNRALERQTYDAYAQYTAQCAQRTPYLAYASTANVARDLDRLRQAVGDRRLTYVGYSYGSILGQTYAALFPGRVRALTVDGVIDAQLWSTGRRGQAFRVPFDSRLGNIPSAEATFRQFTARCDQAGPANCAFAGDARAKFDRLATHLKTHTVTVTIGDATATFDYSSLVSGTLNVLYDPLSWADNAAVLQALYVTAFLPAVTTLRAPADAAQLRAFVAATRAPRLQVPGLDAADPPPLDAETAATHAVACSDTLNPRGLQPWATAGARLDRRYPYFGRAWTWTWGGCSSWRLPAPGRYLGPYDARTAHPVLVVGTTYDPATPYSGAQTVARRLPGARLLTIAGYGHTSLAAPSACATAAFDAYTLGLRLPPRGTTCPQDVAPFTPFP